MHKKKRQRLLHIGLAFVAILQAIPLVIVLFNTFRTDKDIKQFPIGLPTKFNFENYINAWNIGGYTQAYLNSIFISVFSTVIVIVLAMFMGYFLAKSKVKIKTFAIVYFGVALSIPLFSYLAPLYYRFAEMELVNNRIGMVMIYIATNLAFTVLLARTYIIGIPNEITEAAQIDGCGVFGIIGRIIFPLSKPIITTIGLITFVNTWNEFTIANTFLQDTTLKTVATRYVLFVSEKGSKLDLVFTAAMISMLPIIIIFILSQNYFIEGMASGGVKG